MESNSKYFGMSIEQAQQEIVRLKKRMRVTNIVTHSFYLIAIVIIILLFNHKCQGYEADLVAHNDFESQQEDEITNLQDKLNNQRAVLYVRDSTIDGNHGKYVNAIISNFSDDNVSKKFFPEIKVRVSYPVHDSFPFAVVDTITVKKLLDCEKQNLDLLNAKLKMDSLLSDSLTVCLDKEYRNDSTVIMMQKSIRIDAFITNPSSAMVNYKNTFVEYLPNPYRAKTKNSFWMGVGFAGVSTALYAVSEAQGSPVYWDNRDNKSAVEKHNLIMTLRIASGISAAASLFEFGRCIHFHNMEGKFIVNPTNIGLVLYLDKK